MICQIESRAGGAAAAEIAAVDGVAGLFVGRADLALSFGLADARAPEVMQATVEVLDIARRAGKIGGVAIGESQECGEFEPMGASWFVVGSDQALLRRGALAMMA